MFVHDELIALFMGGGARFRVIEHPAEGQSEKIAKLRGTAPSQGAKALVCGVTGPAGENYVLAVVPGDRRLNLKSLALACGARKAYFASKRIAEEITGCVIGAIPPVVFNDRLWMVVDEELLKRETEIAFNAGRLDRSIVVVSDDYRRIVNPRIANIAE